MKKYKTVIDKKKNKGPMYICGDWNARLIYPTSEEEELIMGKHTLHEDPTAMNLFTAGMNDNRERMIELAKTYNLVAMNIRFRKRPEKLATYRAPGTSFGPPWNRGRYETLDYILAHDRWKNSIMNVESDPTANIDSDNFPLKATIKIRLKAVRNTSMSTILKFEKCSVEQRLEYNRNLKEKLFADSGLNRFMEIAKDAAMDTVPMVAAKQNTPTAGTGISIQQGRPSPLPTHL